MTSFWLVSYIALWVLVLIMGVVLVFVLRNMEILSDALVALQGMSGTPEPIKLTMGEVLPEALLPSLSGDSIALSTFRGQGTAFFIVSPRCVPCEHLLKHLAAHETVPYPHDPAVQQRVIISTADASETSALLNRMGMRFLLPVLLDVDRVVREGWGIHGTPTMVIVDEQLKFVRHTIGFTATSR